MAKTITIECTWRSTHTVEVPDDFEVPSNLNDFPEDVLDELDTSGAELVDWQ